MKVIIEIKKGEEVMSVVEKKCREKGLKDGVITSVFGAVAECRISNMSKDDATKDVYHDLKQPLEFSGKGEVCNYKPHIHGTLSGEDHQAIHGHLHSAIVREWFVKVCIDTGYELI